MQALFWVALGVFGIVAVAAYASYASGEVVGEMDAGAASPNALMKSVHLTIQRAVMPGGTVPRVLVKSSRFGTTAIRRLSADEARRLATLLERAAAVAERSS
jgi:hypothetical protein